MQIATLTVQKRTPGGRHANERLRRTGLVPAIIYGHGQPPEAVAVPRHELELALRHLQHVVQFDRQNPRELYLIKDVQYDHLQQTPIHLDLMRVDPDERIRVKVALELKGEPRGIHEGGVLVHVLSDLEIECLLAQTPEVISASVSHLGIGESLHVRDLQLPPGARALHPPDEVVAAVRAPRGVEAAPAGPEALAEAAAEPEVIGRVAREKPEEEAEESR